MRPYYKFNAMELAGAFGDLGTLLPLSLGMIMINGLSSCGVFFSLGLFYILSGMYYGITVSVQPMKVIGAYAVAMNLNPSQITASGLLVGLFLLFIGGTSSITFIGRHIPKSVVRGVQLTTGILLIVQGTKFVIGTSKYQLIQGMVEPYLRIQSFGTIPISIIIGIICTIITLLFLDNKKLPGGLLIILFGLILGLFWGTYHGFDKLRLGIYLPKLLPFGFPTSGDFSLALVTLVLPQLPMTLGNAVIANADLSQQYFGKASKKVTYKALCFSMGIANLLCFFVGGMPLCHGAGGLAAHYRFGARTASSNLMIGIIFIILAIFLGIHALAIINLIPFSVLGILLVFAGTQLSLSIIDIKEQRDLFVSLVMLGITLASNLAIGFGIGIILAHALKSKKITI